MLERSDTGGWVAEIRIPETQSFDLRPAMTARVDMRRAVVEGRVARLDDRVREGTVTAWVEITGEVPEGTRPGLSLDDALEQGADLANDRGGPLEQA